MADTWPSSWLPYVVVAIISIGGAALVLFFIWSLLKVAVGIVWLFLQAFWRAIKDILNG